MIGGKKIINVGGNWQVRRGVQVRGVNKLGRKLGRKKIWGALGGQKAGFRWVG